MCFLSLGESFGNERERDYKPAAWTTSCTVPGVGARRDTIKDRTSVFEELTVLMQVNRELNNQSVLCSAKETGLSGEIMGSDWKII